MSYRKDPNYLKSILLYNKSFDFEREGNVEGFTDTYLQAIELQIQNQSSVPKVTTSPFTVSLNWNVYRYIASFLSDQDLLNSMLVSKCWAEFFRDGRIWFLFFIFFFSFCFHFSCHLISISKNF